MTLVKEVMLLIESRFETDSKYSSADCRIEVLEEIQIEIMNYIDDLAEGM